MSRRARGVWTWITLVAMLSTGCQPTQPFFYMEDGDLSHYIDVATKIEYPDVEEPRLAEVDGAQAPLTIRTADDYTAWDLSLEEVTKITLQNSDVMRQLGGRVVSNAPDTLTRNIVSTFGVTTTWDPALLESAYGANTGVPQSGTGVEAALAEFDAQLNASMVWRKNDEPQNRPQQNPIFPPVLIQDLGNFQAGVNKAAADGTQFFIRNNTVYDQNNTPGGFRALTSDWLTNIEAGFVHPLLQGRGTQYNRIAGPFSFGQYANGFINPIDGVIIQRIRMDQALADFEGGVINLIRDTEIAYWELYFAYRNLEARKAGRDASLATWRKVYELFKADALGGEAAREAQSKSQFYAFRAEVETAFSDLLRAENRLRYIMGLTHTDGRLIRPADEPTTARVDFDWQTVHQEGLVRRVELRKAKWQVKQRELELIAAKNHLLPRLDFSGQYRWIGRGDDLVDNDGSGLEWFQPGSNALEGLTGGDFQEWELGLQFSMPIGNRLPQAMVRHHQILIARERALLRDTELEVSHQIADALRDIDRDFQVSQSRFNGLIAAQQEVRSTQVEYDLGNVLLDFLLDAQRRAADAETNFYRALVDYNLSIVRLHERKGSLLEYSSIWLQEGPWPGKAYFDALRLARRRDASLKLDYGFTRPNVISRGPVPQGAAGHGLPPEGNMILEGPGMPAAPFEDIPPPPPATENGDDPPGQVFPEPAGEVRSRTATPLLSEIFGGSAAPVVRPPVASGTAPADKTSTVRHAADADKAAVVNATAAQTPPRTLRKLDLAGGATAGGAAEPKVDLVEFQTDEELREPRSFNPLRGAGPAQPSAGTATSPEASGPTLNTPEASPEPIDIGWREARD